MEEMQMGVPKNQNEELFKKADAIALSIRTHIPTASGETMSSSIYEWIPVLFNAAGRASGLQRLKYVDALDNLEGRIDQQVFLGILDKLMTNPDAIQELRQKSKKEMNPFNKIKKIFGKK